MKKIIDNQTTALTQPYIIVYDLYKLQTTGPGAPMDGKQRATKLFQQIYNPNSPAANETLLGKVVDEYRGYCYKKACWERQMRGIQDRTGCSLRELVWKVRKKVDVRDILIKRYMWNREVTTVHHMSME